MPTTRARSAVVPRLCATAFAVVAGVVLLPAAAEASGCVSLGSAANYSEYTTGGATVSSDTVAGAAAYGGPSTISALTVGTASAPSAITLVLGSSSTVSATTLSHGSAEYVGAFSGGGNTGTFTSEPSQASLPIQFATAQSSLAAASSAIAALPETNTPSGAATLGLISTGTGTDVFDLTESQLSSATTISIHAPSGAVVVVDVTGTSGLTLSGQTVTLTGGVTAPDVIWNLASVSSATLSAETLSGTVLEPSGPLTMSASHVTGSVLSGGSTASLSANTVNLGLFTGCITSQPGTETPEAPLGVLLPIAALLVMGAATWGVRRRRGQLTDDENSARL